MHSSILCLEAIVIILLIAGLTITKDHSSDADEPAIMNFRCLRTVGPYSTFGFTPCDFVQQQKGPDCEMSNFIRKGQAEKLLFKSYSANLVLGWFENHEKLFGKVILF